MPCLSGRFDPSQGILINLALAKPGTLVPRPGEPLRVQNFLALIDTGATRTCISRQAASAAGLIAMGKLQMVSATQATPMDVYLADIVLPMGTAGFLLPNMQIMEFNCDPNCAFQVLLGRDILAKGVFTLSFDGHFSFSV